jgi:hypothetical protein
MVMVLVDEVQKWPLVGNYAWLSRVTANLASKTQFPPVCEMEEVLVSRSQQLTLSEVLHTPLKDLFDFATLSQLW